MSNYRLNAFSLSDRARFEIQKYIGTMDLQKDNKLPREERLAEIIGVSRITIRQALNDMAAEGLIFRRQGRGTFVNVDSLNMKVRFNPCMEFSQMIKNSGYEPSVKLGDIKKIPRDEAICSLLHMKEEEELVVSEKIFLADGQFCTFCRDYFSAAQVGDEASFQEFSRYEDSVFKYIYHVSGKKCEWDKVEIDTIMSSAIEGLSGYAELRETPDMPLLYLKGVNYDTNDSPILYANEYINTSIIKYNIIRAKNITY
ncbi:hypothetical protein C808_04671 [Lachnospiraceae bacterium M18-1]|nr:hypothetical protein C808_04671 [Lachnospiraceae bacterium M18-1]